MGEASTSRKPKLGGYDFYRSIGSPKWVVAPMVDQSELPWRLLSRAPLPGDKAGPSTPSSSIIPYPRHPGGAHLCYTPMIHASVFCRSHQQSKGGDGQFDLTHGEEGSYDPLAGIEGGDRPLFVQFCANDPDILLEAAKKVQHRCDAVDINFGCPQGIAKRGHYGAFLQDDWEAIKSLIGTLHRELDIPVTAKFRIFPDKEKTIAYAKMMEAAGAQILTCHGRTREMKGGLTGLADWEMIKAVKQAVKVPVFANGNILYREDVDRCLEVTGCDGVMTAEGNLSNPAIFLPPDHPHSHPHVTFLARRYLDIIDALKTPTQSSYLRPHIYRLLKPVLDQHEEFREKISRAQTTDDYREILAVLEEIVEPEIDAVGGKSWRPPRINPTTGYRSLPSFVAQPILRNVPVSSEIGGHEDMVDGEAASATTSKTNAAPQIGARCVAADPKCGGVAAMRCPQTACLIHCRQLSAVANGMDPDEALSLAMKGGLVGEGCDAHESKAAARKERLQQTRRNRQEARKEYKAKRAEVKRKERGTGSPDLVEHKSAKLEESMMNHEIQA